MTSVENGGGGGAFTDLKSDLMELMTDRRTVEGHNVFPFGKCLFMSGAIDT